MNAKQRVILAMSHQRPDKVPTLINATRWVVAKLKKEWSVASDKELLKALHIDIYDMRGIDFIHGSYRNMLTRKTHCSRILKREE